MASNCLTSAERRAHEHVMAIHMGLCCLCGTRQANNFGHRLPSGQGGPLIIPNGLPLCGMGNVRSWGCHGRSEHARQLSYRCGWLIRGDDQPAGRSARIAATPALIRTQLAPHGAWHILDSLDDRGRPIGLYRLADDNEVPGWMWRGTFREALDQLNAARGSAA